MSFLELLLHREDKLRLDINNILEIKTPLPLLRKTKDGTVVSKNAPINSFMRESIRPTAK